MAKLFKVARQEFWFGHLEEFGIVTILLTLKIKLHTNITLLWVILMQNIYICVQFYWTIIEQ